ncbi:MAG: APC family permease [Firmicutes bacterium]|nr:APC family permease [Bacillota bacterium]
MVSRWLLGRPLRDDEAERARVGVLGGLAALAPDALSSVAYGPQALLIPLAAVSAAAQWNVLPLTAVLILLLATLTLSYRQVIARYPEGGGAYVIGRDTLGAGVGLVAGAALLVDYTLTVAVSVTAGVQALGAVWPAAAAHTVLVSILLVVLLTWINLRGIRESSRVLAPITFLFVLLVLVTAGVALAVPVPAPRAPLPASAGAAVPTLVLLRAFSSGASALTGVEALSNGVPVFAEVAWKRARTAMALLGISLGLMLAGVAAASWRDHVQPLSSLPLLQQLAERAFGRGALYDLLSVVTLAILAVAANTSFTGFPNLTHVMAEDRWLPRMFLPKGDRLVYRNGILALSLLAALLIWLFHGNPQALIPLYAIGVYVSFTVTQLSLARVAWQAGRRAEAALPALGAVLTATVAVVSAIAKFLAGAWIVLVAMPLLLWMFVRIRRHYQAVADQLRLAVPPAPLPPPAPVTVLLPVAGINRMTLEALTYARSLSPTVIALHVALNGERAEVVRQRWATLNLPEDIRLMVLPSPYRSVLGPIVRYIDHYRARHPDTRLLVLIPELVPRRLWQHALHNQTGLLLQAVLAFRKDLVVASVPFPLSGE